MRHGEEDSESANKRPRRDAVVPPDETQLPNDSTPKSESRGDGGDGGSCFASNPELWRGLAAGLGLHCQDAAFLEQLPWLAGQLAAEIDASSSGYITHHQEPAGPKDIPPPCSSPSHLAAAGYSVWSGGQQFQDVCRRLRQAADRLRDNGWPPLFLLAYDEAWLLTAALRRHLCGVTGLDWAALPVQPRLLRMAYTPGREGLGPAQGSSRVPPGALRWSTRSRQPPTAPIIVIIGITAPDALLYHSLDFTDRKHEAQQLHLCAPVDTRPQLWPLSR